MPVPQHRSRNVVLQPDVEPAEVRALADRLEWELYGYVDSDPDRGIFYEVRWDTADGGTVHYIIDDVVDRVYMVARHDDRATAERRADELAGSLAVRSLEELLNEFDVNVYPAGWRAALLQLGAGAPVDVDDEFVMRIQESVHHKDPEVRRAVVWAIVYTEWPVFGDLLETMATTDEDPEVAAFARSAAAQFSAASDATR